MRLEARKYLYDIKQAADLLGEFTDGKRFADYQDNAMLRAAVERKFEIIGEALSKLSKDDSAIASRIGEHARIIAFRNILIHGYAEIDDRLVWDIVETKLPALRREVDELLAND
jgi:uncharacterized protein with HEPN domain